MKARGPEPEHRSVFPFPVQLGNVSEQLDVWVVADN